MAQHPLNEQAGSVVIELVMIMPLLLGVLVFVLEAEKVLRSSWTSQAAARIAVWGLNRTASLPSADALVESLRRIDPRVTGCETRGLPSESGHGAFDESLRALARTLPGGLGARFDGVSGAAETVAARVHLGAPWGESEHRVTLGARSWSAYEMGITDRDLHGAGDDASAGAFSRIGR